MKPDRNDLLHVESCALIAIVAGLLLPWWAAALVALAFGIGKEIWDKGHGGVAKWSDVLYDALGVLLGAGINLLDNI